MERKEIEKKCWQPYYNEIAFEYKNFDVRLNDFEIKVGDLLTLKEYDPKTKTYSGSEVTREVKYLLPITIINHYLAEHKPADVLFNTNRFWKAEEIDEFGLIIIGF